MVKVGNRNFVLEGETLFREYFEVGVRCYLKAKLSPIERNGKKGYVLNGAFFTIEEIKKRQTT
jgi:hypothetical protein